MKTVLNKLKLNNIDYNIASTAYATCTTAPSSAIKMAYINSVEEKSGFTLMTGTTVHIKFSNSNTVSNPSLCINKTAAKPIMRYGTTPAGISEETSWKAGEVVQLTFDGTYWQINKNPVSIEEILTRISVLENELSNYNQNQNQTTSVATFAALKALTNGTAFEYTGNCWVVYKSNKYVLLQDSTGYVTVYDAAYSLDDYNVSDIFSGFKGTTKQYQGTIEVTAISDMGIVSGSQSVVPTSINCIDSFELVPGYYEFRDKYFYQKTADDGYTWWVCTEDECIWIRSDCASCPASENDACSFEIVIFYGYNGTPPPFKITPNGNNNLLLNFSSEGTTSNPEEPEETTDSLTVEMSGTTGIASEDWYDEDGTTYSIKLYTGGSSIGHAYWDTTTDIYTSDPLGSPTSTFGPVFYYSHDRIVVSLADDDIEDLCGRTITGIDLYFASPLNVNNYVANVYVQESLTMPPSIADVAGAMRVIEDMDVNVQNDNILHLDFDNPYQYSDGNLAILLKFDSTGWAGRYYMYGKVTLYYE